MDADNFDLRSAGTFPISFDISGTGYSRVADAIREAIVSGAFPAGTRLKVQALSEQFNISTNPIREALQQLQGEGLVVISPNKGATIRNIDENLIRHIYDITEGVDCILANRCASLITNEQLAYLSSIQDRLELARSNNLWHERYRLNHDFHTYIGVIVGNEEAVRIRSRHHNLIRAFREKYGYSSERMREIDAEHRAIIGAMASHDIGASEEAAREHCRKAREDLLRRYNGSLELSGPILDL